MALNSSRVAEKPVSLLWGCELSEQKKTAAFKVDVEEYEQQALRTRPGSTSTSKYDHRLVLNTVCMGEKAKDEFHIIEIVPKDEEGKDSKPVPIACLKPSILPMATLVGLEMMPPITFRLKSGAGPVYVSGQHIAMETECWVEEEEEELEEEEVEEEEEISPVKPNKRPAAQKKTGPAKKKKMEDDFDNGMDSEEDVKGKPAVKGRKPAVKK